VTTSQKNFLSKFDKENKDMPEASALIAFAHVARTICISFTALAARYYQGNLTDKDITLLVSNPSDTYKVLRNIENIKYLLPMNLSTDSYDATLDQLFNKIINEGFTDYDNAHNNNPSLTAANF